MKMAAAAITDSFADIWPEEEQIISESGIIMGKEELEEIILDRIRKIQKNNHRADSNVVCKGLSKAHGLDEKAIMMSLNYMLHTEKVRKTYPRGKESLRIVEKETANEAETIEEAQNEEKLKKCRAELIEVASLHDSQQTDENEENEGNEENDDQDENVSEYSDESNSKISDDEISDESESENLESSKKEEIHRVKFLDFGKTFGTRGTLTDGDILRRIGAIEKRIDQIVFNQNKEKIDIKKTGKTDESYFEGEIFFQRISVLERENKSLQDENKVLKMENEKLKREDTSKSNTAKFDVKNSQGKSNAGKNRTEIVEPSRAAQNSTRNERAGYARGIVTGRGQFQRSTEYSQKLAEEPEQLSRQQNWNTVDTQEQSSSSIHKINTSQWQIPRETSKARPLLSNQITTRNYYGVLADCDAVTRDLENVKSDRIVAPGELEYAEIVKKRTDLARQPKGGSHEKQENQNRRNDQSTESDYAYHNKVSSIRMRQE